MYIPSHCLPSPAKPALQVHLNDPRLFVHVALSEQSCVMSSHSLTSKYHKKDCNNYNSSRKLLKVVKHS